MASEAFSKANEAFVEEDYRKAIELYTEAINEESSKDDYFVNRAHAYIKLENYEDALADSVKALALNPKNVKAYLRKGVANFHLEAFEAAQKDFTEGQTLNDTEKNFTTWLQKCEEKIKSAVHKNKTETLSPNRHTTTEMSTTVPTESPPVTTSPSSVLMPSGPQTRYDWYQTETHVIVTIMLKHVKKEDLSVNIEEHMLSATVRLPSGSDYSLELDLAHTILPQQSKVNLLTSKIEFKLKKCEGIRWSALEGDGQKSAVKQFSPASGDADSTHKYPTSSHHTRDWDKLVADIKKEEKEEKPEGDAALNSLFQQIYADGNDEVKKAMNKSFMESGGTVLSTNWKEIGEKKVDIKPPDGMEYKEWEH